jgi:chromate transporter
MLFIPVSLSGSPDRTQGTKVADLKTSATYRVSGLRLFATFVRLGLSAFGGPAMVAYIRQAVVSEKGYISDAAYRYGVAVCQAIPGATAMQMVAYVGLRAGGVRGALAAYLGYGLPAFLLMVVLSAVYTQSQAVPRVVSAFAGLQVVVVALVANATINFGRSSLRCGRDILLAAGAAALLALGAAPIAAIVIAALVAVLLYKGVASPGDQSPNIGAGETLNESSLVRLAPFLMVFPAAGMVSLFLFQRGLFDLAAVMMKIDLFAFGGGFASVPLMLHEVVSVRSWLDSKTFMDGIALGQVTPGPIVITATFVGYRIAGLGGAIVSTIAIFTPSFIMLLIMVRWFDRLYRFALFRRALHGALVSFVGLLLAVTVRFALAVPWTVTTIILCGLAFAALRCRVDVLWVVIAGALLAAALL